MSVRIEIVISDSDVENFKKLGELFEAMKGDFLLCDKWLSMSDHVGTLMSFYVESELRKKGLI